MRQRARAYGSSRWHVGLAWLAILALLINALVPTAISAASARGALLADASALCGAVSEGTGPAKQTPPAPHHCICCLPSAVGGLLPAHAPMVLPREYVAGAIPKFGNDAALPRRPPYGDARPRGPPITG